MVKQSYIRYLKRVVKSTKQDRDELTRKIRKGRKTGEDSKHIRTMEIIRDMHNEDLKRNRAVIQRFEAKGKKG